MKESRKKFEKYLMKFETDITNLNSCFQLFEHLNKSLSSRRKEMEIAKCFFTIILNSLLTNIIITICRLYENYDGKKRSEINLNRFLNFIEQNNKMIFPKSIKYKIINEDKEKIKKQETTLEKIFVWRDKYLAHTDNKYLLNFTQLSEDNPINFDELQSLIEIAKETVNKYCKLYKNDFIIFDIVNVYDIDNIFYSLTKELKNS
ncbi:MAG: hypothetical protein DRH89_05060 [Candidatus Cloacimonadota bacterium]|nr:MAG: hypothetical protein DRH89_05060 [Candidatus Cloacimonadota bacterium]